MDRIEDTPADAPDDDDVWLEPEDCTEAEIRGEELSGGERAWARQQAREARERWRRLPDDQLPDALEPTPSTLGAVVRAARAQARVNQRELADAAGMWPATVARLRPAVTHRSRYGSPGSAGPARVTAGRPRPARAPRASST